MTTQVSLRRNLLKDPRLQKVFLKKQFIQ